MFREVNFAFAGLLISAGVGFIALPICMISNVQPHEWGFSAIGGSLVGAVVGVIIGWATSPKKEG